MFPSSMIDNDHSFQEMPRNFSQVQISQAPTRSHFGRQNSIPSLPGTIDMSFNRQPLDWSQLQLLAPHSSDSSPSIEPKPTQPRSNKDLGQLLDDWNFPSQPAVPPRMVVWGPYNNKSHPTRAPLQAINPSRLRASATPQALLPQTPPSHICKASKRSRERYMPPSPPYPVTPITFTKRPRTAAETHALQFPISPSYTKYDFCQPPITPNNPPQTQGLKKTKDPQPSGQRQTRSSDYRHFDQNQPGYSRHFNDNGPPGHAYTTHSFNTPLTCLTTHSSYTPNYLNSFYPPSPIEPTSPFLATPPHHLPSSPSPFSHPLSPCTKKFFHANSTFGYPLSNVWSHEWHQAFHQFRDEKRTC